MARRLAHPTRPSCRSASIRIAGDPAAIRYALVWNPPAGFFTPFGNLQMVINLGAGVDQLLRRSDLPDVPVTRISDPNMARMMATYVQMAVIRHTTRTIAAFQRAQREGRWHYLHPRDPAEIRVGVMGLGELGGLAAAELARHRFQVAGWSRTPKQIAGVACMAGVAALDPFSAPVRRAGVHAAADPGDRRPPRCRPLRRTAAGRRLRQRLPRRRGG